MYSFVILLFWFLLQFSLGTPFRLLISYFYFCISISPCYLLCGAVFDLLLFILSFLFFPSVFFAQLPRLYCRFLSVCKISMRVAFYISRNARSWCCHRITHVPTVQFDLPAPYSERIDIQKCYFYFIVVKYYSYVSYFGDGLRFLYF